MHWCYMCQTNKDSSEFYKDKNRTSGYGSRCKPCTRQRDASRKRSTRDQAVNASKNHKRRGARASAETYRFVGYVNAPWCASCGSTGPLTYDHITPVALGGTSDWWNFQMLCQTCNSRKGAKEIFFHGTNGKVVDSVELH